MLMRLRPSACPRLRSAPRVAHAHRFHRQPGATGQYQRQVDVGLQSRSCPGPGAQPQPTCGRPFSVGGTVIPGVEPGLGATVELVVVVETVGLEPGAHDDRLEVAAHHHDDRRAAGRGPRGRRAARRRRGRRRRPGPCRALPARSGPRSARSRTGRRRRSVRRRRNRPPVSAVFVATATPLTPEPLSTCTEIWLGGIFGTVVGVVDFTNVRSCWKIGSASACWSSSTSCPPMTAPVTGTVTICTAPGSTLRNARTSARKSERLMPLSRTRSGTVFSSSAFAVNGLRAPLLIASCARLRMKYCWRRMRPKSEVGFLVPVGGVRPAVRRGGVLVVPRPHVRERLQTVERDAAGRGDAQAGLQVARLRREEDVHRADRVHDVGERVEADLEVVVDRDVEVLLDRLDQRRRAVVVGRVDPLGAVPGDRDPQVARDRHQEAACPATSGRRGRS